MKVRIYPTYDMFVEDVLNGDVAHLNYICEKPRPRVESANVQVRFVRCKCDKGFIDFLKRKLGVRIDDERF